MATLTCANHPNRETSLRCGKCDKPICTDCLVQGPVGFRCRECSQPRRIPTYEVSPYQYLIAAGVAVGLGLVCGVGWSLLRGFPTFGFYLSFLIALAIGYIMGEVISLAVNRKRSRGLQIIAGVGVLLSYLFSRLPLLALAVAPALGTLALVPTLVAAISDIFGLIMVAVGVFMAVSRLR